MGAFLPMFLLLLPRGSMLLNLLDFGISIGIGIEILPFPGISNSIEIDQKQEKSQYRNWYRKSWYRRLLVDRHNVLDTIFDWMVLWELIAIKHSEGSPS